MNIQIEDGIPFKKQQKTGTIIHALCNLQPGQSFFLKNSSHGKVHANITIGRKRGLIPQTTKFTTAQWEQNGEKGIRVWRTE